ncbi:hypothetical protein HMPREF9145_0554 [Segatella salivae F0493]|uniref:Uncharacterized protein n=1 Tax=Segatella salivae F0493 TaxID=1395125 RepID=U2MKV4_9BACT|nr:hypothetical protein HMPREF9145_0554 [Segatella salivae F0493]
MPIINAYNRNNIRLITKNNTKQEYLYYPIIDFHATFNTND